MSGTSADSPCTAPPRAERGRLGAALDYGCRYLLGGALLLAGLTKATDLRGFEDRLVLHTPLPTEAARAAARLLPWLELTCAACLLFGRAHREAALIAAVLLPLFLVQALASSGGGDCGCLLFPGSERLTAPGWLAARNALLLLAAIRVVWRG